jgi:hypothetical protein
MAGNSANAAAPEYCYSNKLVNGKFLLKKEGK